MESRLETSQCGYAGLALFCEFGTRLEANLADIFALGLNPGRAKEKNYLEGPKLSFNKMEELATSIEGVGPSGVEN